MDENEPQPVEEAQQPGQPAGDVQAEQELPKEGVQAAETEPTTAEQEQEEKDRGLSRSQRRTRAYHMARAESYRLMEENARLKAQFESVQPKNVAPKASDYPQGEFDPQFIAETARQAARQELEQARQKDDEIRQAQEQATRAQNEWQSFTAKVTKENPGLQKLAAEYLQTGEPLRPHVGVTIAKLPNSAQILEHILKNDPELVSELNAMDRADVAIELAEISHQLVTRPNARKQTGAPAPFKAPAGGAAPPINEQTGPDDMAAYVKWRSAQLKARSR